jgi:hypothetical protein
MIAFTVVIILVPDIVMWLPDNLAGRR